MEANLYQDQDAESRQVQILHNRIGKLGVIDRAIVLLWLEDLSYEEIGQIVGITAKHVGVKLFRIKELLKQES
jgi:RNA polymerase sigma-70 factor (ECF subfamily)